MTSRPPAFFHDLRAYGARRACVDEAGNSLSYEELDARAATAFTTGIDRPLVFLRAVNSLSGLLAYVGCLKKGYPVFLTGDQNPVLFARQIETYNPNIILTPVGDRLEIEERHAAPVPMIADLCVLLSTSGSTGSPKLVKLTERNIDSNARSIAEYLGMGSDDCAATTLKFNYSYGMSVINATLASGGSLALTDHSLVDPGFWDFLEATGCTNFAGVPYSFEMLAKMEASVAGCASLRFLTQAGGRLSPELVTAFAAMGARQGWRFYVMYGQTEASPRMAYLPPELAARYPASIGRAIPGGAFTILAADGEAIDQAGGVGELCYSGPNIMAGYAERAADLDTRQDQDRLLTGDLARWNEAGLVEIVGRSSRFVKPFGLRISLNDVEAEAARIGKQALVTGNDERIVVGVLADEADAEFRDRLAAHLADLFKLPRPTFSVVALEAFPRLENGKPDYQTLLKAGTKTAVAEHGASRRAQRLEAEILVSRNQILTLLVSGLWHGAAWTFVIWGGIHGLLLVLQKQVGDRIRALYPRKGLIARLSIPAQIAFVFTAVAFTRVFFRSPDVHAALVVLGKILHGPYHWGGLDSKARLALSGLVIAGVTAAEIAAENGFWRRFFRRRRWLRCAVAIGIFLAALLIGDFAGGRFVYVRF